ncbi:MAG TPA: SRPBCC domain-containing protein, partial [Longimicrobiales bacterium]|nr:SRPBCC domain-containing protein [Longimicrobiales bacterium]
GMRETLDRLEELVTATATRRASATPDRDFVFTRIFDAPRELVFDVWTKPEHMAQWFGSHGTVIPHCEMDVRVGGAWRLVMLGTDGQDYPLHGTYVEVARPERLVYTENWEEHPAEFHAMLPPESDPEVRNTALNIVTFEEYGGRTKLTIITRFGSAAVRDALMSMGMGGGWGDTLDRPAAFLAKGE